MRNLQDKWLLGPLLQQKIVVRIFLCNGKPHANIDFFATWLFAP
jgi:sRNA-binding regulator protein Hfq